MSEIQKYPYNGWTDDTKKYFSEKVCCCIVRIPKRAIKNREAVYLFVRKLPSNSKGKAVVFVKNVSLNGKRKIFVIIAVNNYYF